LQSDAICSTQARSPACCVGGSVRAVLTLMSQSSPGDWESGPGQAVVRSLIFHRTGRKST
jgi:hypothetical protein